VQVTAQRQPLASLDQKVGGTHDLPGDTFRLLSDQVAYLKLSSVQAAQVSNYIDRAQGTKGLIIDIRNYPSEFVVFALGSLLVDRPTQFARFTSGDLDNPGAFRWRGEPLTLSPQQPHYSGKVVILVDEVSQSQAEYTVMAFRSAPQAMVVGSTTAGADGNVSQVILPGGLSTMISGIGVFYPDKRPTQRVGIVPDVEMRPTIAGIRAGRDEVLEEALRQILGRQTPADQIEKMARP
jgi:C-terminal processing protease CtpA/Prc